MEYSAKLPHVAVRIVRYATITLLMIYFFMSSIFYMKIKLIEGLEVKKMLITVPYQYLQFFSKYSL